MIDIEIADKQILKCLPNLDSPINKTLREKKISLIYSYGYIFNPYVNQFINPITNLHLKPEILNYTIDTIELQLEDNTQIKQNKSEVENLINSKIRKDLSFISFKNFLESTSIIISLLAIIIGISIYSFQENKLPSIILLIIANCTMHYWISYHWMYIKYEDELNVPKFYINNGSKIIILRMISIPLTCYFIYQSFEKPELWILYSLFFILILITNYFATENLKKNWWLFKGYKSFKEHYSYK